MFFFCKTFFPQEFDGIFLFFSVKVNYFCHFGGRKGQTKTYSRFLCIQVPAPPTEHIFEKRKKHFFLHSYCSSEKKFGVKKTKSDKKVGF